MARPHAVPSVEQTDDSLDETTEELEEQEPEAPHVPPPVPVPATPPSSASQSASVERLVNETKSLAALVQAQMTHSSDQEKRHLEAHSTAIEELRAAQELLESRLADLVGLVERQETVTTALARIAEMLTQRR